MLLVGNYMADSGQGEVTLINYIAENVYYLLILDILLLLAGDTEENPGPPEYHSTFSILHQNIRSIRNKLDYIKNNLNDYEILCFTETKLTAEITDDLLLLEGFGSMYRKDNSQHSGGD